LSCNDCFFAKFSNKQFFFRFFCIQNRKRHDDFLLFFDELLRIENALKFGEDLALFFGRNVGEFWIDTNLIFSRIWRISFDFSSTTSFSLSYSCFVYQTVFGLIIYLIVLLIFNYLQNFTRFNKFWSFFINRLLRSGWNSEKAAITNRLKLF